jgi:small membrane protein
VLIQIILLAAIAVITVLLTRSTAGARHQAVRRLMLVGFVILAVLSVLFPSWLTWLARQLGVGRGADLLLYALVIAFLSSLATTYRTTALLNRRITVLARKVALAEAALAAQEERTTTAETPSSSTTPAPDHDGSPEHDGAPDHEQDRNQHQDRRTPAGPSGTVAS